MEPNNKWIIGGVLAVLGGLGYLYWKHKKATATATPSTNESVIVDSGNDADLSSVASESETGFSAGDNDNSSNSSAYNGQTADFPSGSFPVIQPFMQASQGTELAIGNGGVS